MAEQPMDEKQVLSVLDQLELELTQREQTFGAIKQIRAVLHTYREVKGKTADLTAQKAQLEKDLAGLDSKVKTATATNATAYKAATAEHETKMVALAAKSKAAADVLAALETQVKDKEKFVRDRSAQLDAEIKAKADALTKVNTDYNQFRAEHRLG